MKVRGISYEFTATYFTKSYARAVIRVDIRSNFEDKSRKLRLFGFNESFFRLNRLGRRCYFYETIEKFLDTEIV